MERRKTHIINCQIHSLLYAFLNIGKNIFLFYYKLFPNFPTSQSCIFIEDKIFKKPNPINPTNWRCFIDVSAWWYCDFLKQLSKNRNNKRYEGLKRWQHICPHASWAGIVWESSCLESCHYFLLCCSEQTYKYSQMLMSRGAVGLWQHKPCFPMTMEIQSELSPGCFESDSF